MSKVIGAFIGAFIVAAGLFGAASAQAGFLGGSLIFGGATCAYEINHYESVTVVATWCDDGYQSVNSYY
jgi:uncharacterized membrane protein YgdD (TMEM256/DUF423 family)